jgi:hypothetical protein
MFGMAMALDRICHVPLILRLPLLQAFEQVVDDLPDVGEVQIEGFLAGVLCEALLETDAQIGRYPLELADT